MDQETNARLEAIESQLAEIRNALLGDLPAGGGILSEHNHCRAQVQALQEEVARTRQTNLEIHDLQVSVTRLGRDLENTSKIVNELINLKRSLVGWCAGASFAVMTCWTVVQAVFFK